MNAHAYLMSPLSLSSVLALAFLTVPRSEPQTKAEERTTAVVESPSIPVADKAISAYQTELLDTAFKAASAFPAKPHLKNRCRNQADVVEACFVLDQPKRALDYVEKIEDWRRGKGYADYAFYCAQHGMTDEVQHYLDLAEQVAEHSKSDPDSQDWQIDRIHVSMAKAQWWLGHKQEAAKFEAGTEDFESAKLEAVKAKHLAEEDFGKKLDELDLVLTVGNFDQVSASLETCAQLFDRFYADVDQRTIVERKIKASWGKLPLQVRVNLMTELTEFALDHMDSEKALALIKETQVIVESNEWTPEDHIALVARLAGLRYRAGDKQQARREADAASTMFQSTKESIVDVWRGKALRPLAEAYETIGDRAAALSTYKKAVEEGVHNPNSRPRAEDLAAICCSMAVHGVEPDEALRARLTAVCNGLGQPW